VSTWFFRGILTCQEFPGERRVGSRMENTMSGAISNQPHTHATTHFLLGCASDARGHWRCKGIQNPFQNFAVSPERLREISLLTPLFGGVGLFLSLCPLDQHLLPAILLLGSLGYGPSAVETLVSARAVVSGAPATMCKRIWPRLLPAGHESSGQLTDFGRVHSQSKNATL
jgi:hypothetical protein